MLPSLNPLLSSSLPLRLSRWSPISNLPLCCTPSSGYYDQGFSVSRYYGVCVCVLACACVCRACVRACVHACMMCVHVQAVIDWIGLNESRYQWAIDEHFQQKILVNMRTCVCVCVCVCVCMCVCVCVCVCLCCVDGLHISRYIPHTF